MVAFMLMSVISLVLAGLIPFTITGTAKAALRNTAGLLADSLLADLRVAGFNAIEPSAAPHITEEAAGPLSSGGDMEIDEAKIVVVTVRWTYRNVDYQLVRRAVMFKHI